MKYALIFNVVAIVILLFVPGVPVWLWKLVGVTGWVTALFVCIARKPHQDLNKIIEGHIREFKA